MPVPERGSGQIKVRFHVHEAHEELILRHGGIWRMGVYGVGTWSSPLRGEDQVLQPANQLQDVLAGVILAGVAEGNQAFAD